MPTKLTGDLKMYNSDKIRATCEQLYLNMETTIQANIATEYVASEYKTNNVLPRNGFKAFEKSSYLKTAQDKHFWFKAKVSTPKEQENKRLFLRFSTNDGWASNNPQGIVYIDGTMKEGIDANHRDVSIEWDKCVEVYVYMYTGIPIDVVSNFCFRIDLIAIDTRVEKLWYDLKIPYESALLLGDTEEYHTIIHHLLYACNMLSFQTAKDGSEFFTSVLKADEYLNNEFYGKICKPEKTPLVYCIGHTHIDVAWLWTYAQTREKAQRSFSTMCSLLEEYPEFKFTASQPQLYEYVKESAPEIYDKIKEMVNQGRWEPEGAMWLEADCNLPSGESLIRQIVFGKKFFKDEFGIDSKILWLPDVFGYSASLPQILKKCGVEYFMTSKISWNETNEMPHTKFYWQGIDGSEVFTVLLPMAYSGMLTPSEISECYTKNKDKDFGGISFTTVGYGDGGGGTTRQMLETQRRLNRGIPGMPRTDFSGAQQCFNEIKREFDKNAKELNYNIKWVGELYLELHRGTYTSVGENKFNNRHGEFALLRAESISVLDWLCGGDYERTRINKNWKTLLLNQFHDVIPGSSIKEVYEDSRLQYNEMFSDLDDLISEKIDKLSEKLDSNGGTLVYNPLSFTSDGIVQCCGGMAEVKGIPPFTLTVVEPQICGGIIVDKRHIENDYFVVSLNENAEINSMFDKRNNREALNGVGNVLTAYEDLPRCWDNWEISDYYIQKPTHICDVDSVEPINDGDRAGIKVVRKYFNSIVKQTIWLYKSIERIDFETELDWHENHQIVKTSFPINVNANRATYEIQYGNIERATHSNTSWDAAKFEVCGHKWADISDNGYGVSLLNDCKYGYSCNGTTISLTLVKCGTWPHSTDQGPHKIIYSIYPHKDDYSRSDTVKHAYMLNQPLLYRKVGKLHGDKKSLSLVSCDNDNIIIEVIKLAENSNDIVVRLYDSHNRKTTVKLNTTFPFKSAWICDMLENKQYRLNSTGNSVHFDVTGFEIATILFEM